MCILRWARQLRGRHNRESHPPAFWERRSALMYLRSAANLSKSRLKTRPSGLTLQSKMFLLRPAAAARPDETPATPVAVALCLLRLRALLRPPYHTCKFCSSIELPRKSAGQEGNFPALEIFLQSDSDSLPCRPSVPVSCTALCSSYLQS